MTWGRWRQRWVTSSNTCQRFSLESCKRETKWYTASMSKTLLCLHYWRFRAYGITLQMKNYPQPRYVISTNYPGDSPIFSLIRSTYSQWFPSTHQPVATGAPQCYSNSLRVRRYCIHRQCADIVHWLQYLMPLLETVTQFLIWYPRIYNLKVSIYSACKVCLLHNLSPSPPLHTQTFFVFKPAVLKEWLAYYVYDNYIYSTIIFFLFLLTVLPAFHNNPAILTKMFTTITR